MPEFHSLGEALQAAHDQHQMMAEDYRHGTMHFLDSMNEDQILQFRWIMHNIVGSSDSQLAAYYEGQASIVGVKFGLCPGCGVNHDKEAEKEMAKMAEQHAPKPEGVNDCAPLTDEQRRLCVVYHLDDLREEGTNRLLGFVCTGIEGSRGPCGVTYPSIDDRMLRDPEHCSGCFSRAAHG